MLRRIGFVSFIATVIGAIVWAQTEQVPQWVMISDIHRRANELLNQPVTFLGIQQAYYERGETYFTERGIPTNAIPSHLRGANNLGLLVKDFSGDVTTSTIFVVGDRKKVRPPEAAYNPPPSTLWFVGGHVRKLSDIVYVEVAELGRESKWKGYQLMQSKHWIELILVLIVLALLHSVLFSAFFNLTERPSGSVRAAYLLCLWALVGYLLFREPFRSFFAIGTLGFIVLMVIAGLLSLFLLLSLLLRGS
ncbi:MAG: hypothetical protein NZ805_07625 [Armatimonadetes bacterium]|nr:hypothetical protein [Armatimonadota bacterium]MDW8029443.1 hypothetical protein [Armatimonadota bacterium]